MTYVLIAIGAVVLVLALVFVLPKFWKKKLSAGASKAIRGMWMQVENHQDPHRKVMEGAAILDRTLRELGYTGSLGEKWIKAGPYSKNKERAWKAIKIRNVLAHEVGSKISPSEANEAVSAFKAATNDFLR